jgi:hypothetical protein
MRAFLSSYFIAASFMFILQGYESVFSPKAELSLRQVFPANLTSGGTMMSHHGPAFGTGELQEGGTTL